MDRDDEPSSREPADHAAEPPIGSGASGATSGPRSFVADAVDAALVDEARRARRILAIARRVLTIVGSLGLFGLFVAVFLVPGFMRFPCRSKQSEAKGNLKGLATAMAAYKGEHDRFDDRFAEVGFEPQGSRVRYRYVVTDLQASSFKAWAFGTVDEIDGDLWVIDQDRQLENPVNRCEGVR